MCYVKGCGHHWSNDTKLILAPLSKSEVPILPEESLVSRKEKKSIRRHICKARSTEYKIYLLTGHCNRLAFTNRMNPSAQPSPSHMKAFTNHRICTQSPKTNTFLPKVIFNHWCSLKPQSLLESAPKISNKFHIPKEFTWIRNITVVVFSCKTYL